MNNGICTCAIHCPQSPYHESACCRRQDCDCWCHQVVRREHKEAINQATAEQRKACERAYAEHRHACAEVDIAPSDFGTFFAEWLECERGENRAPMKTANSEPSNDDCHIRSYEGMFDGLSGYEAA